MPFTSRVAPALLLWALCAAAPKAQTGTVSDPAPRVQRFTFAAGFVIDGGYALGPNRAALRRNETGTTTPGSFTLFTADTSLDGAVGLDARVGFALTRQVSLEAGGSIATPGVTVRIANDPERDALVLDQQSIRQYVVDASAVWQLARPKLGRRARPYVIGGAGYLRQLDADRVQVETGATFHGGGGVRYWLRGGDTTHRAVGVRAEARLMIRSGGFDAANKARAFPAISVMGFLGL